MIPIFILQTWLLGLLSLGVVGGAIYFGYEWQQRSWGWDPVLKEWVFAPNFGLNQETMLFAAAIILTLLALAGGMIVKGILTADQPWKGGTPTQTLAERPPRRRSSVCVDPTGPSCR